MGWELVETFFRDLFGSVKDTDPNGGGTVCPLSQGRIHHVLFHQLEAALSQFNVLFLKI